MNRASPIVAADIAVIVTSLMKYAVNFDSGISRPSLHESVHDLLDLADRVVDTSLPDRESLAFARSLFELSLLEPALETLDSIFRNYIVWPPQTRRSQTPLALVSS